MQPCFSPMPSSPCVSPAFRGTVPRCLAPVCLVLSALLPACPEPAPPPEHHRIGLPRRGTLVVDIEMVDTWEKVYCS
jgi:hypothetical protein